MQIDADSVLVAVGSQVSSSARILGLYGCSGPGTPLRRLAAAWHAARDLKNAPDGRDDPTGDFVADLSDRLRGSYGREASASLGRLGLCARAVDVAQVAGRGDQPEWAWR